MADFDLRQKMQVLDGVPMFKFMEKNWHEVKAFQARPDDLLIATYPKAGTTWISEIVERIYYNGDEDKCRRGPIHLRVPFMEATFPGHSSGVEQLEALPSPRLIKTHLSAQILPTSFWEKRCKVIYMARNAKDVAVSYFHFYQMAKVHPEPGTWPEYLQKFMAGDVVFGSWYDHVTSWWEKTQDYPILYLFYEDMKEDTRREVLKVLQFLERDISDEVLDKILRHTSFEELKDNAMANYSAIPNKYMDQTVSPFMRKGISGDWKNHFTVAQSERFDEDYERKMAGSTLRFRTQI